MWTTENRSRYDRSRLRYPSDLTDEEWAVIGPLIPPAKRGGNKRTVDVRSVVNGVMYILSTGCQWAQLPKDLPQAMDGVRTRYIVMDRLHVTRSYMTAGPAHKCVAKPMDAAPQFEPRIKLPLF